MNWISIETSPSKDPGKSNTTISVVTYHGSNHWTNQETIDSYVYIYIYLVTSNENTDSPTQPTLPLKSTDWGFGCVGGTQAKPTRLQLSAVVDDVLYIYIYVHIHLLTDKHDM